jgi:23S rRNA (adenine-N6)-dimethyltransferase
VGRLLTVGSSINSGDGQHGGGPADPARSMSMSGRSPSRRAGRARTERDVRRRVLSQNFLREPGADRYVELLTLDPGLPCVEVGAGSGVLTVRLAGRCPQLVAYEVDPQLGQQLSTKFHGRPGVRVVVADFLSSPPPAEPFQVVGNVPFSLTSAIVDWCMRAEKMTAATIITQLEYARKRTGAYGRWSLLTVSSWPEFSWELRGSIERTQFRPVPRVDAGVLHLARRKTPLVPPERLAAYHRMVELGFSGVGGTLYSSLRRGYAGDLVADAFRSAGLDRSVVVAFVTPDQWLQIFAVLDAVRRAASRRQSH